MATARHPVRGSRGDSTHDSRYKRVEGGKIGTAERFMSRIKSTPGPIYALPALFDGNHIPAPLFSSKSDRERRPGSPISGDEGPAAAGPIPPGTARSLPPPGTPRSPRDGSPPRSPRSARYKDRGSWLNGTTIKDVTYFADVAQEEGPAAYRPEWRFAEKQSPRVVTDKAERFGPLRTFMERENHEGNLCTASPGPKYRPMQGNIDLTKPKPPAHSFGSKGMRHRAGFLTAEIKNGYMYHARPGTSAVASLDRHTRGVKLDATNAQAAEIKQESAVSEVGGLGPGEYSPSEYTLPRSPRFVSGKADRFKDMNRIFISKKHSAAQGGLHSPGPIYNPNLDSIGSGRPRAGVTRTWCP